MQNKLPSLYIILLVALSVVIIACKPVNTNPPAYIKNIAVYKEGYDAIAVYFILADSSGAMTASDGLVALEISLKLKEPLVRMTRPSKGFNDELMNRLLEKEVEHDSFDKKWIKDSWNRIEAAAKRLNAGIRKSDDLDAAERRDRDHRFALLDSIHELRKKVIDKHKEARAQIPKEYFPLGFSKTIYMNFFDVKSKDFKKTKVGIGAFEREALVYLVGRLPFSEFAPYFNADDTGSVKIEFETKDGKVLTGEEPFHFR